MKKLIFVFAIGALSLTACTSETKHEEGEHEHGKTEEMHEEKEESSEDGHAHDGGEHEHGDSEEKEARNIDATSEKNSATTAILDSYLQIKNALVSDDKEGAATAGTALLAAFSAFDMESLSEEQHTEYMDIIEDAKEQAEHIVKSPIEHQREHFEGLSMDINDLVALLGTEKTLYQDFCPMANGGKGAVWLSESEEIKNPFYGTKMIDCGKMQNKIN